MQRPPERNVRSFLQSAAAEVPDRLFLVFEGETMTYREVDERSNQAARAWLELGVRAGDRVGFVMENRPEYLWAWFGLAKIGAILVGVNPRLKPDEVAFIVENADVRVLLVDGERADAMMELADGGRMLDVLSIDEHPDAQTFGALVQGRSIDAITTPLDPDTVVSLIYTSGSTGRPKGVMQTHRNYVLTGEGYAHWLRMTSNDRPYVCLPLFHINAQAYSTMGVIAVRATMVLARRFSSSRFWPDVREHGVTMMNVIGAMLVIVTQDDPGPRDRDHAVRLIYTSAVSAMSLAQRRRIEERFGFRLMTGFGMSEATFGFVEPYDEPPRERSIGVPRQHPDPTVGPNEARVVRDDGSEADCGEAGELLLRNPALMAGYYNDPDRTNETLRDGWLYTGDLVRYDEDGYFSFVDRKNNVIRRRGENISSLEIERTLQEHPQVALSAVIGVPSEYTEEDVLAFVVPAQGESVDPHELWAWLSERLADFKVPRFLQFVDDLPKTPTQKVSKPELRTFATGHSSARHDREATQQRSRK